MQIFNKTKFPYSLLLQKWLSLTVCMHSSRIYCKLLCRAFSLLPLSFPVLSPLTSSVPLCSFSFLISSVWFLSSFPVVGASLTGDQRFGCFYLYLNFICVCVCVHGCAKSQHMYRGPRTTRNPFLLYPSLKQNHSCFCSTAYTVQASFLRTFGLIPVSAPYIVVC